MASDSSNRSQARALRTPSPGSALRQQRQSGSAVGHEQRELKAIGLRPHSPEILRTTDDARAIALEIPGGESLKDHQVHERAWVTVIAGEVNITTAAGEQVIGGPGLMVEFAPRERHAVRARAAAVAAYAVARSGSSRSHGPQGQGAGHAARRGAQGQPMTSASSSRSWRLPARSASGLGR